MLFVTADDSEKITERNIFSCKHKFKGMIVIFQIEKKAKIVVLWSVSSNIKQTKSLIWSISFP